MYFTFKTKTKEIRNQMSFEEAIKDPYKTPVIKQQKDIHKTIQATDEYIKSYWENHKVGLPTGLTEPCDINNVNKEYHIFQIAKKTDPKKTRQIEAPNSDLKLFQRRFLDFLKVDLKALTHEAAFAYVEGRTTYNALEKHQENESKWFLKVDFSNFFPSFDEFYIQRMLSTVYPFGKVMQEQPGVLEHYIKYCLLDGRLPQGAPTSPALSNYCMIPFDQQLTEELNSFEGDHYVYTRYADDLIISCKVKFDPIKIVDLIGDILIKLVSPLQINHNKTRFGSSSGRNWNLGLMLNKDNNITIGYRQKHKLKAKINNLLRNSTEITIQEAMELQGLLAHYRTIEKETIDSIIMKYELKYNKNVRLTLSNILSH